MKTALFKIDGEPRDGDLAVLAYTTKRGGMSYAKYPIRGEQVRAEMVNGEAMKITEPADTPAIIAMRLAEAVNHPKGEWCPGQFSARALGDMLMISCSDDVSDVSFIAQIQPNPDNPGGTGMIVEVP